MRGNADLGNDDRLGSPAQQQMRELITKLPEDSLSLAWRSSLNERLLQTAATKQKKARWSWTLKPALGFAVAGAFAAIALLNTAAPLSTQTVATDGILEAAIVQDHRHSAAFSDVVGVGVNPLEPVPVSRSTDDYGWSEADIESL